MNHFPEPSHWIRLRSKAILENHTEKPGWVIGTQFQFRVHSRTLSLKPSAPKTSIWSQHLVSAWLFFCSLSCQDMLVYQNEKVNWTKLWTHKNPVAKIIHHPEMETKKLPNTTGLCPKKQPQKQRRETVKRSPGRWPPFPMRGSPTLWSLKAVPFFFWNGLPTLETWDLTVRVPTGVSSHKLRAPTRRI